MTDRRKRPVVKERIGGWTTLWALRRSGYPNGYVAENCSGITVTVVYEAGKSDCVWIPRKMARLMAKRINQCLDAKK